MEISKKKPFSYIRLELWVSKKKLEQREEHIQKRQQREEHIQKRISVSRAGTGGPCGHRQGWEQEDLVVIGRVGTVRTIATRGSATAKNSTAWAL